MTVAGPLARLGVMFPFDGVALVDHATVLPQVVALGVTDLWTGEGGAFDALTPLAAAAAWVPTARIGAGVLPAFTRGPAVLAMTAATLAELAPGRVSFGIGASSPVVVEDWNAMAFAHPYERTRDVLRFLRTALRGERVSVSYDTFDVRGFRLGHPPATPPELVVAALRPRMLRLAAQEADGVIVTWLPLADAARVVDRYRADGGGRLIAGVSVCPTTDRERARALARPTLAAYLTVPAYAAFMRWLGRGPQLDAMWAAWERGDRRAALAAIPDELIDELIVSGTGTECRRRLDDYGRAGVDEVVVSLAPAIGDPVDAVRALAT